MWYLPFMDVTMLLCDAAQESGGKLYILGGGWSIIRTPNTPTPMSLAMNYLGLKAEVSVAGTPA